MAALALAASCAGDGDGRAAATGERSAPRLNEVQLLASHNSYHVRAVDPLFDVMLKFAPDLVRTIEYSHPPLDEQLDLGVRGLELDVVADPEGGRFASRAGPRLLGLPNAEGAPELSDPGFKVLHVQDIDFETTCLTLVACLQVVEDWSDAHPDHLPVVVQVEPKSDTLDIDGLELVEALPFTAELVEDLDAEIRSVLDDADVLTPDEVRNGATTLARGLADGGWPLVEDLRGQVLVVLDSTSSARDALLDAFPGARGTVLFPSSAPGEPVAAFAVLNDPVSAEDRAAVRQALDAGMLVRTRSDADLVEGRAGDSSRADAAFSSGAQVVSTDFFRPLPEIGGDFVVALPGGGTYRCNPVTARRGCVDPTETASAGEG